MSFMRKIGTLIGVTIAWVISTRRQARRRTGARIHVLFCMCDHYEPGTDKVTREVGDRRVDDLLRIYPQIADCHKDSDGCKPRRTWFFPPHYHQAGWLKRLVSLCERGYGEIELHLHHGKQVPDTSDNLRNTINQCIEEFSLFGIFGESGGRRRYGFIHGDWALDNSRHGRFCGVNDEISILSHTGCYADFTFPCHNEANPRLVNSIYYATDNPHAPKSHDTGRLVHASMPPENDADRDLMIVEGPLHPHFKDGRFLGLRVFGDSIDKAQKATPARIDDWIRTGIAVEGKEDWIVIKTHTHGATDSDVVLGQNMHELFDYLESKCRDGDGYALHYVTARQLFNIIKAAEAGEPGENPGAYRDYLVSAPRYDSSPATEEASPRLRELVGKTYMG